jgi:hypothetical protein
MRGGFASVSAGECGVASCLRALRAVARGRSLSEGSNARGGRVGGVHIGKHFI